jgi:phosphate transport system permease protein
MRFDRGTRRRWKSHAMAIACLACVGLALLPLLSILYTTVDRGRMAINVAFFTQNLPQAACNPSFGACPPAGLWPALQGSLIMLGLAAAYAVPVGILAGIFLSQHGHWAVARTMRFFIDVMTGIPSVVVGIFIYALFLAASAQGLFDTSWVLSGLAGSAALAVIMLPIVARTTDESLRLVPITYSEAGLALGIRRWRVTLSIVLSSGRTAVITGALLATARALGESAPILLTTHFTQFPVHQLNGPIASLSVLIYQYGTGGYPAQVTLAWGATLLIVGIMLIISIAARLAAGVVGSRAGLGGGG